jgi:uncharacterized protein (DUF2132 family)
MNIKINLDGITLEMMLTQLVQEFGWPELSKRIKINCLSIDPSIKSTLKFLRKTPWARTKVEEFYLQFRQDEAQKQAREAEKAARLAKAALAGLQQKKVDSGTESKG